MTTVGTNASTLQATQVNTANQKLQTTKGNETSAPLKVEQNKVTLSEEGKALLAALQEINKDAEKTEKEKSSQIESFTHGALGLDHPDDIEEKEDSSYSAGQYLKGALSVGAVLLALV